VRGGDGASVDVDVVAQDVPDRPLAPQPGDLVGGQTARPHHRASVVGAPDADQGHCRLRGPVQALAIASWASNWSGSRHSPHRRARTGSPPLPRNQRRGRDRSRSVGRRRDARGAPHGADEGDVQTAGRPEEAGHFANRAPVAHRHHTAVMETPLQVSRGALGDSLALRQRVGARRADDRVAQTEKSHGAGSRAQAAATGAPGHGWRRPRIGAHGPAGAGPWAGRGPNSRAISS